MSEFRSPVPLPDIPDDLSIPQFILRELSFPLRPVRPRNVPFFIEDVTGRGITYEEAHHRTYGLANALSLKWNVGPKDVVCLFSPNHTDYATVIWAVHTLGGIITPANPTYTADELKYQLSVSKAKFIAVHSDCLATAKAAAQASGIPESALFIVDSRDSPTSTGIPTVEELIAYGATKPENYKALRFKKGEARKTIAFLSFSSGTTGKPKAVAIPHFSVIANVIQMTTHHRLNDPTWTQKRISPGDVAAGVLPFFHIYGLVVIMHFMLFCGVSIVVIPKFNFPLFLESIARHRITHLYVVPPQVVLFCKHPAVKGRDFSHVKFCTSGAAPLNGDLMMQLAKLFPNAAIGQGYGLTETATTVCSLQPERMFGTIGSVGTLVPGITAKVVKSDGALASEGEQGELVVKGPAMALGYYENPKATAETFVDGWVRTGDEVIIKNLEVFVVDRLKEIMKVRGFQVAPAELEGHLLLHPDVGDACVVGIPDEYSGEVPMAFVVPHHSALERIKGNPGAAEKLKADIQKHVSDAKVQYKWLTGGVQFVDVIPKNPSGKILRRVLRDQAKMMVQSRSLKPRNLDERFLSATMGRRRIASQVHQQVSRLLRANYIKKEPVWYQAVLENPPLSLPPKAPPPRTAYDQKPPSSSKPVPYSTRPVAIYYLEDDIRRQFFADHPFETFRPTTLVETARIQDPHPIDGENWTRLGQRGRNPLPEDAVRFTLNLYQYHGMSLSEAYAKAVAQFRALRSEHHIATTFAVMEAEQLGSTFGSTEIENLFEREKRSLTTWDRKEELDEGALAARKRWKAIVERHHVKELEKESKSWSKGQEYVRLWQTGNKPNYIPAITDVMEKEEVPINDRTDPMNLASLPTSPARRVS